MASGSDIASAFGQESDTYKQVYPGLLDLLQRFGDSPRVALRYREWRYQRSLAGRLTGSDQAAFARHTYLAALSRLLVRRFLGAPPRVHNIQQLHEVLAGDFFIQQGIDNFADHDHFTWPASPELAQQSLEVLTPLSEAVSRMPGFPPGPEDWSELYLDIGEPLGQRSASSGPGRPTSPQPPQPRDEQNERIFHSQCGSGEEIFRSVNSVSTGLLERGLDEFDTLLLVLDRVTATDIDPLAVTLARANFILALGGMITGPHPPVAIPVYLSDNQAADLEDAPAQPSADAVHTFRVGEPQLEFNLPAQVAEDLQLLEWLVSRLPNYLNGAALRRISQGNQAATEAVLVALHNYLLAPKPRTPVPEPLTPEAAVVMEQTAARLVSLYLEGEDLFWLFLLKNVAASALLKRQKFGLTIVG